MGLVGVRIMFVMFEGEKNGGGVQWVVDGLRRYLSVAVGRLLVWKLDGEAGPVFFKGGWVWRVYRGVALFL